MSSQIKIGDTVRRVAPTVGACIQGREYAVTDVRPGELKIAGPPGWWSADKFELVTPGTLDPTTIRKGSKVRLEDGPEADANYVGGTVGHVDPNGFVIIDHLGTFAVVGLTDATRAKEYRAYRLAAHQPAPEPAYVPGVSGTATVEGKPNAAGVWIRSAGGHLWFATYEAVTASGNLAAVETVTDFVPDEPRPLPTREQVSEAIMTADTTTGNYGLYPDVAKAAADAVLALLDGAR